jgi:hypothetical protein
MITLNKNQTKHKAQFGSSVSRFSVSDFLNFRKELHLRQQERYAANRIDFEVVSKV